LTERSLLSTWFAKWVGLFWLLGHTMGLSFTEFKQTFNSLVVEVTEKYHVQPIANARLVLPNIWNSITNVKMKIVVRIHPAFQYYDYFGFAFSILWLFAVLRCELSHIMVRGGLKFLIIFCLNFLEWEGIPGLELFGQVFQQPEFTVHLSK